MVPFFKKKKTVEAIIRDLVILDLHKAFEFYRNENEHARNQLTFTERDLLHVGAGMCLFFLSEHLPEDGSTGQALMGRAYAQLKKDFLQLNENPKKSYDVWKAYNDALLIHDNMSRVEIATRIAWAHLFPERKFIPQTPLHAYAYYLHLQIKDVESVKIT